MAQRAELLRKLIIQGHVNVAERQVLGTVTRKEVSTLVTRLLASDGAFPHRPPGSKGIYEGARLIRVPSGVEIVWERASLLDLSKVADRHSESFVDVDAAVQRFIDSEWKKGIDGVALT